jgi:uroporphyrinogen decarboxylase
MSTNSFWQGPIKAQPDFENVLANLRCEVASRPTLGELFMNIPLYEKVAGPEAVAEAESADLHTNSLLRVHAFRNMGYDYTTVSASDFEFPSNEQDHKATISLNQGICITDRESFEKYPWPNVKDFSFERLAKLADFLPDGMKLIVIGPYGMLENVIRLTGYENLCLMSFDDPDLVAELFREVGQRMLEYYRIALQHQTVGAIWVNDDWGFKTQTMLSPDDMRRFPIPWHAKIARAAHDAGKPTLMHSCGKLDAVLDNIIDDIGHNGKHSYEDTIEPVEDAYERLGKRICIIGGMDVDFVCRSTPAEVYRRARAMIERSSSRGGYMLGTGNSVPEYVPDENFFALLAAAWQDRPGYQLPAGLV